MDIVTKKIIANDLHTVCNDSIWDYFKSINITDSNPIQILLGQDKGFNNIVLRFPGDRLGGGIYVEQSGLELIAWDQAGNTYVNNIITTTSDFTQINTDLINGLTLSDQFQILSGDGAFGTNDPFGRPQLLYKRTNDPSPDNSGSTYAGLGGVERLGSLQADGDSNNIISEGITVYGTNSQASPMDLNNFGYSRIKPNRFQLYDSIAGVPSSMFIVDGNHLSYMHPNSAADTFFINDIQSILRVPLSMNNNNIDAVLNLSVTNDVIFSGLATDNSLDNYLVISGGNVRIKNNPLQIAGYTNALGAFTTSSLTYVLAHSLNLGIVDAGDYLIEWNATGGCSNIADSIVIQYEIVENAVSVITLVQQLDITNTSILNPFSKSWHYTTTGGLNLTANLNFLSAAGNPVSVQDIEINAYKIS